MAIFLAYALIMGFIERMIPIDVGLPGIKLGLANVVVLTSLYIFRFPDALKIAAAKSVIVGALSGSVVSFCYSVSGSILSFLAMWLMIRLVKDSGVIGVSVVGAVTHNLGQLLAAAALLGSASVFWYLPALIVSGVAAGILVGILTRYIVRFIRKRGWSAG